MVTTYCIVICSTNGTPGDGKFTFAFSLCKPMTCYPGMPDTAAVSCIHVSFSPAFFHLLKQWPCCMHSLYLHFWHQSSFMYHPRGWLPTKGHEWSNFYCSIFRFFSCHLKVLHNWLIITIILQCAQLCSQTYYPLHHTQVPLYHKATLHLSEQFGCSFQEHCQNK